MPCSGLAGIIALAPNGDPQHVVRIFPQIAESVARAHALVTESRGNGRVSFTDGNIRGLFAIETTPTIYLSFFDPAGPADMLANTMRLREPVCGLPVRRIEVKSVRLSPLTERLPTP